MPLTGLKIIDLTTRLPGPLSTKILSDLGASVIKIEDIHYADPFNTKESHHLGFKSWYEGLNQNKNIIQLDFNDPKTIDKIAKLILDCDGLILGLSPKVLAKLKIDVNHLKTQRPSTTIEIRSQKDSGHGMHDLNILAETGLLNLFLNDKDALIENPPFLPIAGINFAQSIATTFLAHHLKALKLNLNTHAYCYLDESIKNSMAILFDQSSPQYKSLHNGKFPCYNLYRTKDHNYVAVAAVEEKYWQGFLTCFHLPNDLDRFDPQEKVFNVLTNFFQSKSLQELKLMTSGKDICVSFVKLD